MLSQRGLEKAIHVNEGSRTVGGGSSSALPQPRPPPFHTSLQRSWGNGRDRTSEGTDGWLKVTTQVSNSQESRGHWVDVGL